jgi:CheY-like chemotaxis protein
VSFSPGSRTDAANIPFLDNVVVAHDGQEALARFTIQKIDLVLLDINMPRMNGFELLEQMRSENLLDRVAVVMCSTSIYQEDISRAQDLKGARSRQGRKISARADTSRSPPISAA